MSQAANINITRGNRRPVPFTIYGPGGPNRPASLGGPDIDTTTVVTSAAISVVGGGLLAVLDPGDNRRVFITATGTSGITGPVKVTIPGVAGPKEAAQFVNILAPPNAEDVVFGPAGPEEPA